MRRVTGRAPTSKPALLPLLCPPDVFGIVQPGVYRSNTFRSESYSFVKTLRLNTVVSFRAADVHNKKEADQLSQFLEAGGVQQIVLRSMQGEGSAFSHCTAEEAVKQVLEAILDVSKHPVLLMCRCAAAAALPLVTSGHTLYLTSLSQLFPAPSATKCRFSQHGGA